MLLENIVLHRMTNCKVPGNESEYCKDSCMYYPGVIYTVYFENFVFITEQFILMYVAFLGRYTKLSSHSEGVIYEGVVHES